MGNPKQEVFVVDAVRTAIGRYGGALSSTRPDDLLATCIRAVLDRNPAVPAAAIEDVIAGAANQAGEDNRNVARMSALLAGLPVEVAGNTVNRLCASGLQAIMDAARAIMCGDGDVYLAGGVESMSRAPFVVEKAATAFSRHQHMTDTTIGWRFVNPVLAQMHKPYTMGETAENVADAWKISREEQDDFAFESQQKYHKALAAGRWKSEIIPVEVPAEKGVTTMFDMDEHPRQPAREKLAGLKAAFREGGTVTAGNSSGINDGASMLLLTGEQTVRRLQLRPLAKVLSMAVAGVDPSVMGIGPVKAVEKALARADLAIEDIDLMELNEAFAAQSIACIRELNIDASKVNVNGGAIALGHPLGCSGARIATTLLHEMQRRQVRYGVATMCVGVGQGAAMVFERTGPL